MWRWFTLPYPPDKAVAIQQAIYIHCENQRYRFTAIDCDSGTTDPSTLDPRLNNHWDTEYAAFYSPWIVVSDPETGPG